MKYIFLIVLVIAVISQPIRTDFFWSKKQITFGMFDYRVGLPYWDEGGLGIPLYYPYPYNPKEMQWSYLTLSERKPPWQKNSVSVWIE